MACEGAPSTTSADIGTARRGWRPYRRHDERDGQPCRQPAILPPMRPAPAMKALDRPADSEANISLRTPRVAVVLFNLGGPDRPEAIRPFLLNLFSDPAILRVPFFVRPFLARWIARSRLPAARANYALLGGKSPLLGLTQEQAEALQTELSEFDARCF